MGNGDKGVDHYEKLNYKLLKIVNFTVFLFFWVF